MALGWLIPTLANQPRKNTFGKHLWSLWLLKNHDLCYLVCPRKYLMLPLSLQDEHAGDCDWHCPAEPLVIDTTKPGSKPFLKGPQSKHSNVEHKRLLLRVQRKAEHKPTPPEHSVTISTLHTGQYWKDVKIPTAGNVVSLEQVWHWTQGDIHVGFFGLGFLFGVDLLFVFLMSSNRWGNRQRHKTAGFGLNTSYCCKWMPRIHVSARSMPGDSFTTLLWAARSEFCHCTQVPRNWVFSVRLSHIIAWAMTALWWYLLEIKVSMTINSRAIKWCY